MFGDYGFVLEEGFLGGGTKFAGCYCADEGGFGLRVYVGGYCEEIEVRCKIHMVELYFC